MEGGSLFNPGFLGSNFNWWIGQIVDDSTWRDNISDSKIEGTSSITGWGRRYKVSIIGLHDREESTIPSDQLPWAQVMYPVTAGGGQASALATPNLRQGNFVFGFFLDGTDQQVPVIMGVLGNNAQTKLEKKIGNGKDRYYPTSGHAQGASPDTSLKAPDQSLSITGTPNNTIEQPDNPHLQTVADVKRQELYEKRIVLLNPCDLTGSALKAIQTKLQELVEKINKKINAVQSYIDAATSLIGDIQELIADFACQIAKYVKIIFDKLMEYILKQINKAMAPTVQTLPPNKRNLYLTIKEKIIELIHCLFNRLINNLCGQIQNYLNDKLNVDELNQQINNNQNQDSQTQVPYTFTQVVSICTVEELTGAIIYTNKREIDDEISRITNIINGFLSDIAADLSNISGELSNISSSINGIAGSIMSALSFSNISLNIFGCDLTPKCAVSDFYTLQEGGGGSEPPQLPRLQQVDTSARNNTTYRTSPEIPFAVPSANKTGVNYT